MQYRRIEYVIKKDGTVIETVLSGTGESCLDATKPMEEALGAVSDRTLLPTYHEQENLGNQESQDVTFH